MDYLFTGSVVKRHQSKRRDDPLPASMAEPVPLWGDPEVTLQLQQPLFLRVGRGWA